MSWAERHIISVKAEHISGSSHLQADWLSQTHLDPSEWQLHPQLFLELSLMFSKPVLDLFIRPKNAQLLRFFLRFHALRAESCNALCCRWPEGLLYAFPPICLIPRVLQKLISEQAEILLIVPHWPCWPWFADLVALSVSKPWRIPP